MERISGYAESQGVFITKIFRGQKGIPDYTFDKKLKMLSESDYKLKSLINDQIPGKMYDAIKDMHIFSTKAQDMSLDLLTYARNL